MYDQIREDFFFIMIYSAVTTTALMASCYLLFRRGNAFAPDITPPARLRRWTAVFLALIALNHILVVSTLLEFNEPYLVFTVILAHI